LIRCNFTTENYPELTRLTTGLKKIVHSSLEVDFTETLKLKYETKPPKLSSHGDELGLSPLSTDPPGELDVLGHDGDTLGVDGAQVGVLEQPDQVSLAGLLKSSNSGGLEPEIGFEILSDFPHETLEGQLPDEQLGGLLVSSDLPESHSSGPVSVRLLHSSGGGSGLPGSLGGQLLPGSLSSGGLTSGLLGTGHGSNQIESNVL